MGIFNLFGKKSVEKHLSENSKSENQLDLLKKIKNKENADELKNIYYGQTNLPPEILTKVLEEISITLSEGKNPKSCKAKNHIPDNFEWKEYDEWFKKFYDAGEWPPLWEDAADCFSLEQESEEMTIDELLNELDKTDLITIAGRFNRDKIENKSAKVMCNRLLKIIKPDDEETKKLMRNMIRERSRKSLITEKKYLYQHTLMAVAITTQKKNEWNGWGIKEIEFSPGLDTCSFCDDLKGVYSIDKTPIPGKDTHPGCLCSFLFHDSEKKISARDEIKAKYESGEWPMKRCLHCKEWIEGNATKCEHCNKIVG